MVYWDLKKSKGKILPSLRYKKKEKKEDNIAKNI